jgi:hypothetical protein
LLYIHRPIKEQACEIAARFRKVGAIEALQAIGLNHVEQSFLTGGCFILQEVTSELCIVSAEHISE